MIYVDLDGVLADFGGAIQSRFNKSVDDMKPKEMWPRIMQWNRDIEPWFESLDKCKDADELWSFVVNTYGLENVAILTSAGTTPADAPQQKRRWVAKYFGPEVRVFVTSTSKEKAQYASYAAILIDDRKQCTEPFAKAGGRTILHKNAKNTIENLKMMVE